LKRHFDVIVDKINFKVDELDRELKRVRFAADAWYSAIDILAKIEKVKFVQERGVGIQFPLDLSRSLKAKSPGKFYNRLTWTLTKNQKKKNDTHFSPLLDTRKPDFVFIPSDSPLDPLSVVAVDEVKKRVNGSSSNADIGHAI
ncbi:3640_t:CDS:2, partial [Acaulospora colombiana]